MQFSFFLIVGIWNENLPGMHTKRQNKRINTAHQPSKCMADMSFIWLGASFIIGK